MKLIEARITFTEALAKLLTFGYFLCERASLNESRTYSLILDETKRSRESARWNAGHCRVVEDGRRCERSIPQHVSKNDHDFKPIGISDSTHVSGLAADILVMVDGEISNDEKLYRDLGEYWKKIAPHLCWGGDFIGFQDLGHFSHEWRGRK